MAKAHTHGSGWHNEHLRHSNARKFGKAGGKYADSRAKWYSTRTEYHDIGHTKMKDSDGDGVPDKYDCQPNNPNAQADYKTFDIGGGYEVIAHWEKTRNGFRHLVVLMKDGQEIDTAKETYLNRTWESYEFETAINKLLNKAVKNKEITEQEKNIALARAKGKSEKETEAMFGNIAMVAKMGEVLAGDTKKERNDWKKRMLKAGLPELDIPEDWDTLSEEEKERRLNMVIDQLQKKG